MSGTIFLIEDDESIRRDFSELLQLEGYQVQTFSNGKEGLEGLQASPQLPQVILLDLMMPVLNGYEFLEALEVLPQFQSIPILVLSADRGAADRIQQKPGLEFMRKPIELELFLTRISQLARIEA